VIVEKIRLRPFGGVSDASLTFSEGLNVVLGPNEAGKTTVFNAAQNAIFTPAGLTASPFSPAANMGSSRRLGAHAARRRRRHRRDRDSRTPL
jgi:ABC-type branched-subunit amino acid transport system ATPase component